MAPAVLFPHTHIDIPNLEQINDRFGPLTLFQPWFMEGLFKETHQVDPSSLLIKHPPEAQRPKRDFKGLIAECKTWLRENRDRGYADFLRATQRSSLSEDTPWEIRKWITQAAGNETPAHQENQTIKWHLILHLARELEESRMEAERLLSRLKDQKSPLDGALEEAPSGRFFEDTPLMDTELRVDVNYLRQVLEAWFGLFGASLGDDESFITLDPQVWEFASELFESNEKIITFKHDAKAPPTKEVNDQQPVDYKRQFPLIAHGDNLEDDPIKKGLSGRTLILIKT